MGEPICFAPARAAEINVAFELSPGADESLLVAVPPLAVRLMHGTVSAVGPAGCAAGALDVQTPDL
jgi:hypothetical protein